MKFMEKPAAQPPRLARRRPHTNTAVARTILSQSAFDSQLSSLRAAINSRNSTLVG